MGFAEKIVVDEIQKNIRVMSDRNQTEVRIFADIFRSAVKNNPATAAIALALVGAEMAAED